MNTIELRRGHKILITLAIFIIIIVGLALYRTNPPSATQMSDTLNFDETGYVTDREPERFNDGLYLVYEKPGAPALSVQLAFDEQSMCSFNNQDIPCIALNVTIDTVTQGKRATVSGLRTNNLVLVRRMELVQTPQESGELQQAP